LRVFSFGGYGLARAALALVVFGAYDSYPKFTISKVHVCNPTFLQAQFSERKKKKANA